ncbi:MAG: site-specific DNA-methyltransferase [Promethearchaeota archaeon]
MRNEIQKKFQRELSKFFQFGNQDYNFGIQRLLNFKREQIEELIHNLDLLNYSKELSEDIYNLVLEFFSQYYKRGKFFSGRKSGETIYENEIILDWLNKDQYYVKNREPLRESNKIFSEDYFIHKNLKDFYKMELNNFIKDKILGLDPLQIASHKDLQKELEKVKTFEEITSKIIDLLVQLENFQLKLWFKKSVVLKTNYVITLDKIMEYAGESFLESIIDQILNNKGQMKEWLNLFEINIHIKSELQNLTEKRKSKWEHLPIDTKYFDEVFKWNLISFLSKNNDLDELIDGTLIKSDNFQALNLLMKKWHEKVNLIYIDPPFNTGKKEFLYKNDYLESSWLVMMNNRLNIAKEILHKDGNIFVRIDNNGNHLVRFLLNLVFGKSNFRNEIIINKTRAKKQCKKPFIQQTESLFFYSKRSDYFFNQLEVPRKDPQWFELLDFPRPNKNPRIVLGKTYYPPKNRRWGLSQERINDFEQKGKIRINKKKRYVDCFGNIIEEKPELYYDSEPVRNDWLDIPGYSQVHKFSTENSEEILQRVIESGSRENDVVLDFFLGSGTTIAVAQKLNRKWIGIEIGDQFEEFIIPRMKTVLYGDKTGISKNINTSNSGFVKYQYLEQFEDSIENIELKPHIKNSILNYNKIEDPFEFKVKILKNGQSIPVNADLIETFNYLLGIFVEKYDRYKYDGKTYIFVKGKVNNQNTIIIWRSIIEIDYEQDKKIIMEHLSEVNYSYIYVNGKSLVENSIRIEIELKKLIWK